MRSATRSATPSRVCKVIDVPLGPDGLDRMAEATPDDMRASADLVTTIPRIYPLAR
jgi:hypothetical protein